MSKFIQNFQKVTYIKHWAENLFSFRIKRPLNFKFRSGEFVMIGLNNWSEKLQRNKPIMRAYSVASPNHQETIEFYSIKVQDGPLTSKLQHVTPGDKILVNDKAVGTLVNTNIKPGRNLYLLAKSLLKKANVQSQIFALSICKVLPQKLK